MDIPAIGRKCADVLLWLGLGLACLHGAALQARVLTLEVDAIQAPQVELEDMRLTLDWPDAAATGSLSLRIKQIKAESLGQIWRDLRWRCTLQQGAAWQCDGPVQARGQRGLSLQARLDQQGLSLALHDKNVRLGVDMSAQTDTPHRITLTRVPLAWFVPLLQQAAPDLRLTHGYLDAQWHWQNTPDGLQLQGPLSVQALGLDSRDGRLAAEGMSARGQLTLQGNAGQSRIETELNLDAGEFLAAAMYVQLAQPVQLALRLSLGPEGIWQAESLQWKAGDVLDVKGRLRLQPDARMPLREADLEIASGRLDQAHAQYLDSLLGSLGFSNLRLSGGVQANLTWREGRLQNLDARLQAVEAQDGAERFGVSGLTGTLALRAGSSQADSELKLERAHVHGLALGPLQLSLRSAQGGIVLRNPVETRLLGGRLHLQRVVWQPAAQSDRIEMALKLEQADLAQLSRQLGWPAFTGAISGELPAVRYSNEVLSFEGGLRIGVFSGQVAISQLSMERPFGVAPTLAASLEFSDLDLEPLTGAFGFGEITGKLDGHVHGLRLVNWEPVAFDAALRSVTRRGVSRRISQRAVRDLTEVGGGGIGAGLQNQMLKAFSSFGYSRIGLSCVLANNVCSMGGVGPAEGGGFYIVEGSGVPRVNVIGHSRKVDWPVLLARLKAATQGQAPVIE